MSHNNKISIMIGRLTSLAILVMLVFAPIPLCAQSISANDAPISNAQLNKIVRDIQQRNKLAVFDQKLTKLHGLTKSGETLTAQYRALKDEQGIYHTFILLRDGYLLARRTAEGVTSIYIDTHLQPISTVFNPDKQVGVYISLSDSTKSLNEELRVWAEVADQLN